jgi:hypothetical protein
MHPNLLYLFLFVFSSLTGFAQDALIQGTVIDSQSKEPIPYANIFLSNSTLGAPSDGAGTFLFLAPIGKYELVASHIAYKVFSTNIVVSQDTLDIVIELMVNQNQLDEITVKSKLDDEWNDQFTRFKKEFFGNQNSNNCQIVNPWVIEFSKNKDELMANASTPLEIENKSLGYHLTFHLTHFHSKTKGYSIQGHSFFEPLIETDVTMKAFEVNRVKAYYNSSQSIFKSILNRSSKKEGYELYIDKPGYEKLRERSNVFSNEINKTLVAFSYDGENTERSDHGGLAIRLKGRLEVHHVLDLASKKVYNDVIYPVSWIESSSGIIKLDSLGNILNPSDLLVSGYLDQFRVASLLPVNYRPDEIIQQSTWQNLPVEKFNRLQEKVFLHTNKGYYYPGDIVWFKGYIKYSNPQLQDSLSRVLYVELINHEKIILAQEQFRIDSGRVQGQMILNDELIPGKYYLRAYTRWMMNYPVDELFIKPLPILEFNEILHLEPKKINRINSIINVQIIPNKENHLTREKIDITVKVSENDLPTVSDFSVAIIDTELVDPVFIGPSIYESLKLHGIKTNFNSLKVTHPIEYGISLSGTFKSEKKKKTVSGLIIMRGDKKEIAQVTTTDRGDFFISGFNYYDTANFSIRPLDAKGRINLLQKPIPTLGRLNFSDEYQIEKVTSYYKLNSDYIVEDKVRLLDEVLIKDTPIDRERTNMGVTYGKPDYVLTGEQLRSGVIGPNLTEALAGKIPGLSVTTSYDYNGVKHYNLRIRGGYSSFGFTGTIEPMVLVDGVPFASRFDDQNTVGDFLVGLSPEIVDHIEVITRANPLFGVNGTNGVIIIYTKKGTEIPNRQTVKSTNSFETQTFKLKGYTRHLEFKSPNYGKSDTIKESDFRSTIYWNPNGKTDSSGKYNFSFYASDNPTTYKIHVIGMTHEGLPFDYESYLKIVD